MEYGFNIYATSDHYPILEQCIASLQSFSKYPITVYSINDTYQNNSVRVKTLYLPTTFFEITKAKIISAINTDYDITLTLDADMLATPQINKIFETDIVDKKYPLFCRHPHNPFTKQDVIDVILKYAQKYPVMPYVYAHFIHHKSQIWFFEEVLQMMGSIPSPDPYWHDELFINCVLTKYGVDYDLGYNYMPNGTDNMFYDYINGTVSDELKLTYLMHRCPVRYYAFHGHSCKNPDKMRGWLDTMRNISSF